MTDSVARWARVQEVFHTALEQTSADRDAFLRDACGGDRALRAEVDSLLLADEEAGSFAEQPAIDGLGLSEMTGSPDRQLQPGDRLGPYTIVGWLGAGGMGEVYRARDGTLERDVALKILPRIFHIDPERRARFDREARLLAALNHPHIGAIYGVVDSDGFRALVLELVEGLTLAERLASRPMEIPEALRIATEIAEALEAAHEKGVIHRDLKPANVKLTPDGRVKVLDFGLAKAASAEASGPDLTQSPTRSDGGTREGVLLGTAAYMSPEQARGKPVDKRTDVWAFACVLYEMLSGRKAFDGQTVSHIIVHVMEQEPDWEALPADTPAGVQDLLERCFQKDRAQRLRDIGDVRIQLLAAQSKPTRVPPRPRRQAQSWLAWGVAGVALLAVLMLALPYLRQKPLAAGAVRFEISQPGDVTLTSDVSVSPDGRKLAFIATTADGRTLLWVRSLETLEARPLDGTEGVTGVPFWSADSRFVAFGVDRESKLKKIDAAGGPAQTLCDAPYPVLGGLWTPDDKIVFGMDLSGLLQVPASGGTASVLTTLDRSRNEIAHTFPSLLPDGKHFIYERYSGNGSGALSGLATSGGIFVGSLDGKPDAQTSKRLLADISNAVYVPAPDAATGHLLFVRGANTLVSEGTLMAQPFDTRRLELAGDAVPIAEHVPAIGFSASSSGVLVYHSGLPSIPGASGSEHQLTWFDRQGNVLSTVGEPAPGFLGSPVLSPDGTRAAAALTDPQTSNTDIWLFEFARGLRTRFTLDPGTEISPVWSPDGSSIAYASNRGGHLDWYQKPSNGLGDQELLFKSDENKAVMSWSRDGRFLAGHNGSFTELWALPMDGSASSGASVRKPFVFLHGQRESRIRAPRFSPDGRWISYVSNESRKSEIYVRPFDPAAAAADKPASGEPFQVSKGGGDGAHWRADGKELFYVAPDGSVMAVEVTTGPVFQAGVPAALFKIRPGWQYFDVSADGKRLLIPVPLTTVPVPYKVVLNWTSTLKR